VMDRSFVSLDMLICLAELFLTEGIPEYIRSVNGPEFIANKLRVAGSCPLCLVPRGIFSLA